jgi:hypothetical protein
MNLEELGSIYDFTDCTAVVTGGAGVLGSEIAGGCIRDRDGYPDRWWLLRV